MADEGLGRRTAADREPDIREPGPNLTILRQRDAMPPDWPEGDRSGGWRLRRFIRKDAKNLHGGLNSSTVASVLTMDIDQPHPAPDADPLASGVSSQGGGGGLQRRPQETVEPTDEDLLQRFCVADDGQAYEVLVRRYERELFNYLRRYLGSAEMAEDVFQATFLQVHLKREQFEQGRRFRPWLYTIATNQAIDAQRRNRRHRMVSLDQKTGDEELGGLMEIVSAEGPTAIEQLEDEEAREWVRTAVEDLPETLRAALVLVYHQGLKYREAADVLGIPVGTVKSRLHAALLKLNQAWSTSGSAELRP